MAETPKILAQADLTASLADIYAVPGATNTVVSSIVICNYTGSEVTVQLTVNAAGAADATKFRQYWNVPIPPNDSLLIAPGYTLAATDKIRAQCNTGSAGAISVYGVENT